MSARAYSPPWRRTIRYLLLIVFALVYLGPFLI